MGRWIEHWRCVKSWVNPPKETLTWFVSVLEEDGVGVRGLDVMSIDAFPAVRSSTFAPWSGIFTCSYIPVPWRIWDRQRQMSRSSWPGLSEYLYISLSTRFLVPGSMWNFLASTVFKFISELPCGTAQRLYVCLPSGTPQQLQYVGACTKGTQITNAGLLNHILFGWVLHCWAGRLLPIKESHWISLVVCTPIISHWYKCFSRHSHLRHERWLVVLFPLGGWKTQEPWSRGLVHLSSPPVEQDIAPTYPTYHWGYTPLTKLLWPNKQ